MKLERYLAKKFHDIKLAVSNKTAGVVTACNKLLKCMEEGTFAIITSFLSEIRIGKSKDRKREEGI